MVSQNVIHRAITLSPKPQRVKPPRLPSPLLGRSLAAPWPLLGRSLAASVMLSAALLRACNNSSSAAPEPLSGYITTSSAVLDNTTIDVKVLYPKLSIQVPSKSAKGDTTIQKFTVNPPDRKLIFFGKTTGNTIAIPAATLCDPVQNGYGPSERPKPCVLAKSSISLDVRSWTDAQGHAHADFSPNLRFNPSAPVPVKIYFEDRSLLNYSSVYIPFCSATTCVDEGASDPALTTYVSPNPKGGYWVHRMLRHFSGYNVTAY